MPYREKLAWLSLLAMAVTFGPYFVIVGANYHLGAGLPSIGKLGMFAVAAVVQMLLLGIGHLVLRRRSPEEARTPLDERDRAIKYRSLNSAYYVLIGGMILVGVVMPFTSTGWRIVDAALFMIVVAEVVHYSVVVSSYRRQA